MNKSIRVSAKTVDDAITEALIQLGVTSDKLEYEVIEKGSAGFLGIGVKQAVIEARRKEEAIVEDEPVLEDILKEVRSETVKLNPEVPKKPKHKKEHKSERRPERKQEAKPVVKEEPAKPVKPEVKEEVTVVDEKELAPVEDVTMRAVEKFLNDTLKAMDMEVEITSCVDEDGALSVEMKGDNMGILIGKRGQTLDSLQYLANRVWKKFRRLNVFYFLSNWFGKSFPHQVVNYT